MLVFWEWKDELELMAQTRAEENVLEELREQGGEQSQVTLSKVELTMFDETKGVNAKYDYTHRPFSTER